MCAHMGLTDQQTGSIREDIIITDDLGKRIKLCPVVMHGDMASGRFYAPDRM